MEWWRRAERYGDPPDIVDERVLDFHKAGSRGEELHWAAFEYAPKVHDKLKLIQCNALVLTGTKDEWLPTVEQVAKIIPKSTWIVIPDGPVYMGRLMPKEFAEAILTFLRQTVTIKNK
jgi:pimeloyl-ACP methyl ester carboxylesterase